MYYMVKEAPDITWFHCKVCNKRYRYATSVYNHRKYDCDNKEPQFECDFCKKRFKQKGGLKMHMANIHNVIN